MEAARSGELLPGADPSGLYLELINTTLECGVSVLELVIFYASGQYLDIDASSEAQCYIGLEDTLNQLSQNP